MQCPIDGETLLMTARNGVEIDYCPRCRGVWFHRGELDKIIERWEPVGQRAEPQEKRTLRTFKEDDDDKNQRSERKRREKRDDDDRPSHYKKSKSHASFIKELFDF